MNKRNGLIDFYKLIFAFIVAGYHASMFYYTDTYVLCSSGYIGVEFFFIISGYLLASKASNGSYENIFDLNIQRIKKRIVNIFPFVALSVGCALLIFSYTYHWSIKDFIINAIDSNVDIFGLQMTGITGFIATGVTWYISALYIIEFIIYPLLCVRYKMMTEYIAPILLVLIAGYLCNTTGNINDPGVWLGFVYKGLLRGIMDFCAGIITYEITNSINVKQMSNNKRKLFSLIEIIGFSFTIIYAVLNRTPQYRDFYFIPVLMISIALAFSRADIFSTFFDKPLFAFCGKYSLSIYLNHFYLAQTLPIIFSEKNKNVILFIYIITVLSVSYFNYKLGNIILKKIYKNRKSKEELYYEKI